jgi:hypothetical protein
MKLDVSLEQKTIWLTQDQLVVLYGFSIRQCSRQPGTAQFVTCLFSIGQNSFTSLLVTPIPPKPHSVV